MPYPTIAAGQRLTAGALEAMQLKTVTQGTLQVVNNSSTLADTNIVVPVLAGATYRYWLLVGYTSAGEGGDEDSSDMRVAWSADSGIEVRRWSWGYGSNGTGGGNSFSAANFRRPNTATDVRIGASGEGVTNSYYEQGLFIGGTTTGNATFQFAQWVADTFDLSITASSRVDYVRIA